MIGPGKHSFCYSLHAWYVVIISLLCISDQIIPWTSSVPTISLCVFISVTEVSSWPVRVCCSWRVWAVLLRQRRHHGQTWSCTQPSSTPRRQRSLMMWTGCVHNWLSWDRWVTGSPLCLPFTPLCQWFFNYSLLSDYLWDCSLYIALHQCYSLLEDI